MKRYISALLMFLCLCAVSTGCTYSSLRTVDADAVAQPGEVIGNVHLEITADEVFSFSESVEIFSGDTVFSVLERECGKNDIALEFAGSGNNVYVESISGMVTDDSKGWIYYVNYESALVSAGGYKVAEGDVIQWQYEEYSF